MEKNVVVVDDDGVGVELTSVEKTRLKELENVIDRNTKGVFEWGLALMEIRGKRLYRADFTTFEDYVRARWDMGRSYASRLIGAGQVYECLLPIGNILPVCEAQVRPLLKVDPPTQRKVWEEAAKSAPGGRITARLVNQVVKKILGVEVEKKVQRAKAKVAEITDQTWLETMMSLMDLVSDARKKNWEGAPKSEVLRALKHVVSLIEG